MPGPAGYRSDRVQVCRRAEWPVGRAPAAKSRSPPGFASTKAASREAVAPGWLDCQPQCFRLPPRATRPSNAHRVRLLASVARGSLLSAPRQRLVFLAALAGSPAIQSDSHYVQERLLGREPEDRYRPERL